MADAKRDQNHVPSALGVSSADSTTTLPFKIDPVTGRLLVGTASGSGTVTGILIATANGFAGTSDGDPTTPTLTLTTTVTGILEGNGTAISAASTTGSGAVVLANTPTLITPNIGAATGTSLSVSGALRSAASLILEETGAGTDTITIQAPSSIAASYTLTLPIDDGDSGQVLSTDGNGVLSWASSGGVPTTITVASETVDTSCFVAFFTAATGAVFTSIGRVTCSAASIISASTLSGYKDTETPRIVLSSETVMIVGISVPSLKGCGERSGATAPHTFTYLLSDC